MPDINIQTSIEGFNPFVLTTAAQDFLADPGTFTRSRGLTVVVSDF